MSCLQQQKKNKQKRILTCTTNRVPCGSWLRRPCTLQPCRPYCMYSSYTNAGWRIPPETIVNNYAKVKHDGFQSKINLISDLFYAGLTIERVILKFNLALELIKKKQICRFNLKIFKIPIFYLGSRIGAQREETRGGRWGLESRVWGAAHWKGKKIFGFKKDSNHWNSQEI